MMVEMSLPEASPTSRCLLHSSHLLLGRYMGLRDRVYVSGVRSALGERQGTRLDLMFGKPQVMRLDNAKLLPVSRQPPFIQVSSMRSLNHNKTLLHLLS